MYEYGCRYRSIHHDIIKDMYQVGVVNEYKFHAGAHARERMAQYDISRGFYIFRQESICLCNCLPSLLP